MNEKTKKKKEITEIDFKRLGRVIWHKSWIIAIVSVLCAVVSLLSSIFFITKQYQASAMFYVNNNSFSLNETSFNITSSDITASKSLVNTYIVILNTRACLNEVIEYGELDKAGYSYSKLKKQISATAVNETEVFKVVVTDPDPDMAKHIAKCIADILPNKITSIVEGTSAKVVDNAVKPVVPSSPDYAQNTLLGFLIGFVLSLGIIILRTVYDVTIRREEDIEQSCAHPILAAVPDMLAPSKGGYYYGYGKRRKKGYYGYYTSMQTPQLAEQEKTMVGKNISFAATEAYKLLRTKLQFSFVDEIKCPVIGVSSAMAGEGKSLSSVNLAYSLAQLKKRVLLIDCDMRRPSLSTKLPIEKTPGLSEYLTGHNDMENVLQYCKVDEDEGFTVIASGHNPPNPIELLSSSKMSKAINSLRENYDYIILDLPPVGEVSDAMVAAKTADGILLVVRQDYCNTVALSEAVNQFEFIDTRILGVVMNCVDEHGSGYRYGYGKKYYRRYYSKYSRYAYAQKEDKNPQTPGNKEN
ncbi:MAG: polysaccharide biosynthesis tyrosine autokinase [Clostridia bacterium]|nr:polysaccharide biosynthesis tyrosine autokinase [Clostridia bacterium]